jgi:hypothetical protein
LAFLIGSVRVADKPPRKSAGTFGRGRIQPGRTFTRRSAERYYSGMQLRVLVLVVAIAAAQTPGARRYQSDVCPSEPPLEVTPSSQNWFEGSVGERWVRIYLERGGEAVVGILYDTDTWLPVTLGGRWKKGGIVELTARINGAPFGQLNGQVTSGGFAGSWEPQGNIAIKGGSALLKTVSQPNCAQFAGALRQFNDPQWPVTFSYPDSWRLDAQVDALTLTCPDPSAMAYSDFDIRVTQGSLAREGAHTGGFVRCGETWRYGPSCDCDNLAACKVAEISYHDDIAIVAGDEQEWRVYCRNGGYVAQGFGYDRVLVIDNRWVDLTGQGPPSELIKEIVKTVRRRR